MPEDSSAGEGAVGHGKGTVFTAGGEYAIGGPVYVNGGPGSSKEEQLRTLLAEMRALLDAHPGEVDDPERVRRAIDALAEESRGDAEPGRVRRLGGTIVAAVAFAASFGTAAANLTNLVRAISAR